MCIILVLSLTTLDNKIKERGKTSIHLAMVSIFARMMGKDSFFCDVSQHVVSEVVATSS